MKQEKNYKVYLDDAALLPKITENLIRDEVSFCCLFSKGEWVVFVKDSQSERLNDAIRRAAL